MLPRHRFNRPGYENEPKPLPPKQYDADRLSAGDIALWCALMGISCDFLPNLLDRRAPTCANPLASNVAPYSATSSHAQNDNLPTAAQTSYYDRRLDLMCIKDSLVSPLDDESRSDSWRPLMNIRIPRDCVGFIIAVLWHDQGWGNAKGRLGLCNSPVIPLRAPREPRWEYVTCDMTQEQQEQLQQRSTDCVLPLMHIVGGGGGHRLQIKHLRVLTFRKQLPCRRLLWHWLLHFKKIKQILAESTPIKLSQNDKEKKVVGSDQKEVPVRMSFLRRCANKVGHLVGKKSNSAQSRNEGEHGMDATEARRLRSLITLIALRLPNELQIDVIEYVEGPKYKTVARYAEHILPHSPEHAAEQSAARVYNPLQDVRHVIRRPGAPHDERPRFYQFDFGGIMSLVSERL